MIFLEPDNPIVDVVGKPDNRFFVTMTGRLFISFIVKIDLSRNEWDIDI
jgi:hypothetical protein